jgi:hypothetical protein
MENNISDMSKHVYEELDLLLNLIRKIATLVTLYDNKNDISYFYIEMENELLKINLKYLDSIINCFTERSGNKNLLKLYDFIVYEFKRLRSKYEEMDVHYFSLDEESRYVANIKLFIENNAFYLIGKMGYLYLRLCVYNLTAIYAALDRFRNKIKPNKQDIESYKQLNLKQKYLCKVIADYIITQKDDVKLTDIVELNHHTDFFNSNLIKFITRLLGSLKVDLKEKGIFQTIKQGLSNFMDIMTDKLQETARDPDVQLIKL